MTNEVMTSEHQLVKEMTHQDDPKAYVQPSHMDEKQYISSMMPDKNQEMVHGHEQVIMMPAKALADMGMYEGMTNVMQQVHLAGGPHMQPSQATPYYQVMPPPNYYQHQPHYATIQPMHGDPAHASVAHQQYTPTVMYVPMQFYPEAQTTIRHHAAVQNVAGIPTQMAYHQVPVEYASQTVTPVPVSVPQQTAPQTTTAAPPSYKSSHRQRIVMWNYCQFCQNNKEPEEFYKNHTLRDSNGRVICPVLRAYNCPLCNNGGGDRAHTKSYCPQLRSRQPQNGHLSHGGRRGHNHHGSHPHGHNNNNNQAKMKSHSQQFQANAPAAEQEPN